MKIIQTKTFRDAILPASFAELVKLISAPHPEWGDRVWMWRGQSNIDWPVHSSAYRRLSPHGNSVSESTLIDYEEKLLAQATHKGYRIFNDRELTDLELLARLQHHGAATRLVDFTRSMTIALWYTAFTNRDKYGALIGFHSAYVGGYEGEVDNRSYKALIEEAVSASNPITWEPTTVSNRIAAQHSQFIYSHVSQNISGSLLFPDKTANSARIYAISPKLKEEAIEILEQVFDIRYHTLFPDIDGFCEANSHTMPPRYMFRW